MIGDLGHYRILDEVGSGSLGDVYRARDTRLGRTVAITSVRPDIVDDPARRKQFLADAQAAATLSHPNIAILYEVREEAAAVYLVREFVLGKSVRKLTDAGPMNPRRAVDLAAQVADALAEAHAEGVAHRMLRSEFILETQKGSGKILDFGLAHWTSSGEGQGEAGRSTHEPEPDHRRDIFDLGGILLEMLAGARRPGPARMESVRMPEELRTILERALNDDPERRYGAAATLAAELRSVGAILDVRNEATDVPEQGLPERSSKSILVWLAAIAILSALAALIWLASRTS
jgi:serine/threonine-protein kinase